LNPSPQASCAVLCIPLNLVECNSSTYEYCS